MTFPIAAAIRRFRSLGRRVQPEIGCWVVAGLLGIIAVRNAAVVLMFRSEHLTRSAAQQQPFRVNGTMLLRGLASTTKVEAARRGGGDPSAGGLLIAFSSKSKDVRESADAWVQLMGRVPSGKAVWLVSVDEFSGANRVIEALDARNIPYSLRSVTDSAAFTINTGIHELPAVMVFDAARDVAGVASGTLSKADLSQCVTWFANGTRSGPRMQLIIRRGESYPRPQLADAAAPQVLEPAK